MLNQQNKIMITNSLKLEGTYILECRRSDGSLRWKETVKNIVTNAGKAQLALLCGDASAVPFTYIALGTSSTAVAATDTQLTAEISTNGLSRAAGTVSRVTTTVTNDTFQITKTFTASGSQSFEEIGIFNAASTGTMLSHALTGTKSVINTDQFVATYQLKFS